MRWPVILLTLLLFAPAPEGQELLRTEQRYPTRGTPRWKMYMDPADSSRVWLLIADNRDQLFLSTDGGGTYGGFEDHARNTYDSPSGGEVFAWIDNHAALTGHGDNLWVTYPRGRKIFVKKISSPAGSTDDVGPGWEIETDPNIGKRATIVANQTQLFVFSRTSRSPEGNLRFFQYDHGGELISSGFVEEMGKDNIRIGATLDAAGQPVIVVWAGAADAASLRYYRWNGSSFDRPKDSLIWDLSDKHRCDRGERTREYAFAVTDDDTLHVTWTCSRKTVIHGHKKMGAKGHWSYTTLAKHKAQHEYDFNTTLTTRGREVHAFFTLDTKKGGANLFYSRWDPASRSWAEAAQLTQSGDAAVPNTVWKLNADATQVPFAYWRGAEAVVTGVVALP